MRACIQAVDALLRRGQPVCWQRLHGGELRSRRGGCAACTLSPGAADAVACGQHESTAQSGEAWSRGSVGRMCTGPCRLGVLCVRTRMPQRRHWHEAVYLDSQAAARLRLLQPPCVTKRTAADGWRRPVFVPYVHCAPRRSPRRCASMSTSA